MKLSDYIEFTITGVVFVLVCALLIGISLDTRQFNKLVNNCIVQQRELPEPETVCNAMYYNNKTNFIRTYEVTND